MTHILLAHGDDRERARWAASLRRGGFDVDEVTSAADALAHAAPGRYAAALTDAALRDLDGFALCVALHELRSLEQLPVVVAIASPTDADRELASAAGVCSLVDHSEGCDALPRAVARALEQAPAEPPAIGPETLVHYARRAAAHLERCRALFESAHDSIALVSTEGIVVAANRQTYRFLGRSARYLIGRHIRELAAPGNDEENIEWFHRILAEGSGRTPPLSMRRRDGTVGKVEFAGSRVDIGGDRFVLLIGRDVTEQVRASHLLADSEERYRALLDNMPDVLWTGTLDRSIRFMTGNAERVLGVPAATVMAAGSAESRGRIHPDDLPRVDDAFAALIAGLRPVDIEFRWRHGSGAWIWLRNRVRLGDGPDGPFLDGILSDVTARRDLEEQIRHAQKMEAIGELTGGIAHDFNNLLSVVLSNAEFLLGSLAENDPRRVDANEIKEVSERAALLTRQLLAFSRRQILEPTDFDLNAAVRGLARMLRRVIGEDIDLSIQTTASSSVVHADPGQIEQVILNMVLNARDAMPDGGTLRVATADLDIVDDDTALAIGIPPGRWVVLSFADNGCGMDESTRRRVFEPFFTTKPRNRGTGLGLSTSYGTVQQSGGAIRVESEPGAGTTFHVYLPRAVETARARTPATGAPPKAAGEVVLLVEDEARVRAAVARLLRRLGYQVIEAADGRAALAAASGRDHVDLLLTDIVMPGASGPELAARLRARHPTLEVVFMTGHADHALLELTAGDPVLQKPFTSSALARKLREVLAVDELSQVVGPG
jgi:two-component system, cell cycle sensor histidine kinase and response regulator CckA